MLKPLLTLGFVLPTTMVLGQIRPDSARTRQLDEVTVTEQGARNQVTRLAPVAGTYIFDGKKSEVIAVTSLDANLADKTGRQIFAKVPGVFVYDMDGAGNQLNIATRGLDPHRGWEFNIRQNGVLTNSDLYGYPASHYSAPLESVERIELVRGTGSLQYGAQFGGLLNYVTKQADPTKPFRFESYTTLGAYNLLSSYNAVGGTLGKLRYYAYVAKKSRDGYRQNEHTDYDAESLGLTYAVTPRLTLRAEWARSSYLYRIPGPLTDAQFAADPRQATRARNYFSPTIHVPSLRATWQPTSRTQLELTSSAVLGARNSVLFDKPATVKDSINPATGQYNPRQVDIDRFHSYTTEARLRQDYTLGRQTSHLVAGVQLLHNDLHRTQLGKGTTGSDYDLTLTSPGWGRDVHFRTRNLALFAENTFRLAERLTLNAGARFETGASHLRGSIVYYPADNLPLDLQRHFLLLGSSFTYQLPAGISFYGGLAQAYRPMVLKDLIPSDAYERVNPAIQDARGYNAELGSRGSYRFLEWDVTAYLLRYNNRFGTIGQVDASGSFYTYRTNIGNSLAKGLEVFVQGKWPVAKETVLTLFTSTALLDGRYTSGSLRLGGRNVDITGNEIEGAPRLLSRNGLTLHYRQLSVTGLYSYTARSYADALNTATPSANGAVGPVPAYGLLDVNATCRLTSHLTLKAGLNNVTDRQYFTKRPLFYPGPGVWPSDGRNGSVSLVVTL